MQDRLYLLSVAPFLNETDGEELMEQAFLRIDEIRRKKAERIIRKSAKAACIGAGLLLQLAVQEFMRGKAEESSDMQGACIRCTVGELLSRIVQVIPLEFTYGKNGKPYMTEYPVFFNISHSGEYVVCAVSEKEIGVDIQEHRKGDTGKIAKRFFSSAEIQSLEQVSEEERTQLFFDLWAEKEAYGKYTGVGIAECLEQGIPFGDVDIEIIRSIPGYSLAVCKANEGEIHEEIIEVSERL